MKDQSSSFEKRYKAFISYSHSDNREEGRKWADWLHHQLETYEVPEELVGKKNQLGDPIPAQIFPVFQDEKELAASSDLNSSLKNALQHAEFLVYLSSPQSAQSTYVREELRYFKQIGKSQQIIALILKGEPTYNDTISELQCFPEELRYAVDSNGEVMKDRPEEVLAADVRIPHTQKEGFTSIEAYRHSLEAQGLSRKELKSSLALYKSRLDLAVLKIVSGILHVPLGEFTKRDKAYQLEKIKRKHRQTKRIAIAITILAIIAVITGIFAVQQKNYALKNLARSLYNSGINKLTESEFGDGAAFIAEATRQGDKNAALFAHSMLATQDHFNTLPNIQTYSASFTPDGKWLASYANSGLHNYELQLRHAVDGALYKKIDRITTNQPARPLFDHMNRLYTVSGIDRIILRYSLENDRIDTVRKNPDSAFLVLKSISPAGDFLAFSENQDVKIRHLSTKQETTLFTAPHSIVATNVYFSPNKGLLVLTIDFMDSFQVKIFKIRGESIESAGQFNLDKSARNIQISKDDQHVLCYTGSTITCYHVNNQQRWEKESEKGVYDYVGFSPDGNNIVAGIGATLMLYGMENGQVVRSINLPENAFAPGTPFMEVLKDDPNTTENRSPDRTQELVTLNKQAFIQSYTNSPLLLYQHIIEGKLNIVRPGVKAEEVLLTYVDSSTVTKLDFVNNKQKTDFLSIPEKIVDFDILKKSGIIWLKGASKKAYFFDATTGKAIGKPIQTAVRAFLFDQDQLRVLARTSDRSFAVWDIKTGEKELNYEQDIPLANFTVDPSFTYMLLTDDRSFQAVRIKDKKIMLKQAEALSAGAFSPQGKYLIVVRKNGHSTVYDTVNFADLFSLESIENPFIAFNNKGDQMAISADATHMRLWDLNKRKFFGQSITISTNANYFQYTEDGSMIFVPVDGEHLNTETKLVDAKTGNVLTMPFAPGRFDATFILKGDKQLLTLERLIKGYAISVWEVPGQLSMDKERLAGDIETYYGKKYDPETGAINGITGRPNRFKTWYFEDSYTRRLTPAAPITILESIRQHIPLKTGADLYILGTTYGYHPLARAAVADFFSKKPETTYLAERFMYVTLLQLAKVKDRALTKEVNQLLAQAKQNLQHK